MIEFRDVSDQHRTLLERAQQLALQGVLTIQVDGYSYLKVDDRFVHELFPLVDVAGMQLPNYFSRPNACGAHISVAYPEERARLQKVPAGGLYVFTLASFYVTSFAMKRYAILVVDCPPLGELRQAHGLGPLPHYQGFEIPFHITVAVG